MMAERMMMMSIKLDDGKYDRYVIEDIDYHLRLNFV